MEMRMRLAVRVLFWSVVLGWSGSVGADEIPDVKGQCVAGCRYDDQGILVCDQPCESGEPSHDDDAGEGQRSGGRSPISLARIKVGIVGAPAWKVMQADGTTTQGSATRGLDVEVHFGSPFLAAEAIAGFWFSRLDSPAFGTGNGTTLLVPFGVGLSSSPVALVRSRFVEVRPDVGADLALVYTGACSYCGAAGGSRLGARGKAGLDLYFGAGKVVGLSVDLLVPFFGAGDVAGAAPTAVEIDAPSYAVRIGAVVRNPGLTGW